MVVKGITIAGMRQIFAVEVVKEETEENYRALFSSYLRALHLSREKYNDSFFSYAPLFTNKFSMNTK